MRLLYGTRQELEQDRLELDQGDFVFPCQHAGGRVYLQLLALGFEDYAAGFEIVEEA
jgi:hypothetical protein